MKVFFNASITGKEKYLHDYMVIIQAIKELGHTIYSDHVIKNKCDKENLKLRKDYRKYSASIKNLLSKSDVMIVENSFPSTAVGYLLHLSLQQRKHVLVLYKENPHRLLVGDSSKFLILRRYNPDQYQKLKITLGRFFEKIRNSSLYIRFNLMIDETINQALEKKSRREKISKADYVRRLIEENISKER